MVWEYEVTRLRNEYDMVVYRLNELGKNGWELVSIVSWGDIQGIPSLPNDSRNIAVFKRQVTD